jgi:lysine 2,3-aminomutase
MTVFNAGQRQVARRISEKSDESNWTDWKWQLRHSIRDVDTFQKLLGVQFEDEHRNRISEVVEKFPMSVAPYYLSLIDPGDWENDPVFKQCFPSPLELNIGPHDECDPLHEDEDSPAPCITHRYPDRVLLHASNVCSMYCRHCTRKRKVGDRDSIPDKADLKRGIDYVKNSPQVRDLLISGGDPLMLDDERLDWILGELGAIEHLEVVRIGSRMPAVLPYRITDDLARVLKSHHPVWLNTHFNHPREMTTSAKLGLARLADAGIPLGNQSVLLAGVNDCPRLMRSLVHKLVRNRVRPYYLYQCDLSEGLTHFRTKVSKGIEILESLRGHTSGFAVPTYVIDAPGGGGKIPVSPNYVVSWGVNKVVLRNYEGVITTYSEPEDYKAGGCDRDCGNCKLNLKLEGAAEHSAVGIEKLLLDWDDTQSLTPENTRRLARRAEVE